MSNQQIIIHRILEGFLKKFKREQNQPQRKTVNQPFTENDSHTYEMMLYLLLTKEMQFETIMTPSSKKKGVRKSDNIKFLQDRGQKESQNIK